VRLHRRGMKVEGCRERGDTMDAITLSSLRLREPRMAPLLPVMQLSSIHPGYPIYASDTLIANHRAAKSINARTPALNR
jgi:hypothetical protein